MTSQNFLQNIKYRVADSARKFEVIKFSLRLRALLINFQTNFLFLICSQILMGIRVTQIDF